MLKSISLALVAFGLLLAAPGARAQAPSTLSATGIAQADVEPENRNSETSIRAAVQAARAQALPLAIADAKRRAQELATAAGVTLGALTALSDSGQNGFYGGPYGFGTFGYDQYCGRVPKYRTVRRDGRRVRVRVKGSTRRVCRVPREVYATTTVTFAVA